MKIGIAFLLTLSLFATALAGDIQKSSSFSAILDEVNYLLPEQVLIVCDIDNTLLKAAQHLGSVEWSEQLAQKLQASGISKQDVARIENIVWQSVQPHISVELVDSQTADVIRALQARNINVICLTARSPEEADYSFNQLNSLGIELHDLFKGKKTQILPLKLGASYQDGVIFATPFNKKSEILLSFLQNNTYHPNRIVFIDDKLHHVEDVVEALAKYNIPCKGIWFTGAQIQE